VTELTDQELERYGRQIVLPQFGGIRQRRLKAARVAVVGAGGIGSSVIPALAGAGVGALKIIDDDVVDLSNLHRQPMYTEADAGKGKAKLAAAFVTRLNSHVELKPVRARIDGSNAAELLGDHDLVIDGSDNFATRLAVSDAAVRLRIPLLSAAAVQLQGQVALFRGRPCYRCFVGDAFDSDDCDNCAELGVLGPLAIAAGSFAALLAVNTIADVTADSAGTLNLLDGASLKWRQIRIPADPGCKTCGQASA
jgi:molybdopterin-synthase adenylyltransferase